LINNLRDNGLIPSTRVYEAMLVLIPFLWVVVEWRRKWIERILPLSCHTMIPRNLSARAKPYVPMGIGGVDPGQISAPHMHANAASALEDYARPGAKVLDVGCGSGYLTAVRPAPCLC